MCLVPLYSTQSKHYYIVQRNLSDVLSFKSRYYQVYKNENGRALEYSKLWGVYQLVKNVRQMRYNIA